MYNEMRFLGAAAALLMVSSTSSASVARPLGTIGLLDTAVPTTSTKARRAASGARSGAASSSSGASSAQSASVEHADEVIRLQVGQQMVLPADGVRSYSEGTRGVVDVRLTRDASQFVLVGQQGGITSLLFIMNDGRRRQYRIEVESEAVEPRVEGGQQVVMQDNIRLDFYFVQLNRSNNLGVGIGYPESVSAGTFAASFDFLSQSFQAATAVIEDQALLRLDMAQASGWAKLMRRAAVITANGQMANFSGGGEVNIPVQGSLTTGIHRIAFGSTIEVLPRYDESSRRIEVTLKADVSDLTDDRGSGAPGRVTSTISTIVNLELGQAIVLAGLTAESEIESRSGVPYLSQVPVLGLLFGTKRVTRQLADNVVFIVPSVIDSTSRDSREKIRDAFEIYRKYKGGTSGPQQLREKWEDPRPPSREIREPSPSQETHSTLVEAAHE